MVIAGIGPFLAGYEGASMDDYARRAVVYSVGDPGMLMLELCIIICTTSRGPCSVLDGAMVVKHVTMMHTHR